MKLLAGIAAFAASVALAVPLHAQEAKSKDVPLNFEATIAALSDTAEQALVAGAIRLTQDLGDYLATSPPLDPSDGCGGNVQTLKVQPDIDIEAGQDGAFQRIVAKATGTLVVNSEEPSNALPELSGALSGVYCIADFDRPIHTFPFSLGVETTRYFDTAAILGEIGYVPYKFKGFGPDTGQNLALGVNPVVGFFLQGGYKFGHTDSGLKGGSKDESAEKPDSAIFRLKADMRGTFNLPSLNLGGTKLTPTFMPWATGWYDIANNDLYYSVGAKLRLPFPSEGDANRSFDFMVAHGSGEPNFNTGTQFGVGLTITY